MDELSAPVAVFDSGVGGVSVLRCLLRELPGENFLFYGDSANAPYGVRPTAEIRALTLAAARRLFGAGAKALVVACNTATAAAINELREAYPQKIVIGIEPALKPAVDAFPHGTVAVMATQATLREEKFHTLEAHFAGDCRILTVSPAGLVELVERGMGDSPEAEALLRPYLAPLAGKIDALVLGCTHFPFASAPIRRILGESLPLYDGGGGTARETRRRLAAAGLLNPGPGSLSWENSLGTAQIYRLCERLVR
ncbi:MAG: glutamate racemase [Firmicutes bacterium]|nr:glutamate racemase [Bacillota bacterium]